MNMKLVEPLRELFKDEVRDSAASSACRPTW
jgi:GMP synthase, PP-ATPase domain/subunit